MKPLEGIKVIDMSTVLAGPSVGTFLAELGADVLKIEHPSCGDVTRSWKLPLEDVNSSVSAYFSSINYLKEYQRLDLSDPKSHANFLKVVVGADILLTNFKKGDDVKLGIEDHILLAQNPRLIIGKINGYGTDNERVAYDLILQAESGFMSMNGTSESGPIKMPVALIDVLAAHHLKEGILLALYERERSNCGKSLSVSLYDAAVSSLVNQASNYLMTQHVPKRIGSLHPNIAPYGELFETLDGATITFAIGSTTHFNKLCEILHLNELTKDSRYSDNQSRVLNRSELFATLNSAIKELTSFTLLKKLQAVNVPAGKVKNLEEVFSDQEAKDLIREEVIDGIVTKRITSVVFK